MTYRADTDSLAVPGWNKIVDEANRRWGDGERDISTNEAEVGPAHALEHIQQMLMAVQYPEHQASICVTNNEVDVAVNGSLFR